MLLHEDDVHVFFSLKDANAANAFLKSHGIIVRGLSGYGLPDALRVSIGQEDEMRLVVSLLQEFME